MNPGLSAVPAQSDPSPVEVTVTLPAAATAEYRETLPYEGSIWPAGTCGDPVQRRGCHRPFEEGQAIRKVHGFWMHDQCARDAITAADVDAAWLLLADQVAERPHKFRATEIRVVLRAVLAIAARGSASPSPEGGDQ